jgi:hypothetical protein
MIIDGVRVPMEPGISSSPPAGPCTATSIPAAPSRWCGWTASTSRSCRACGPASCATTPTPATHCPSGTPTGTRRRNRRAAPGRHAQRTAQPGPPLPMGRGLPGPPAADGAVPRPRHSHQPGVRQPAHRRPRPRHPGLPARGPARRRPDPAAPGSRKLEAVDTLFRGVFGPGYRAALDHGLPGAFEQGSRRRRRVLYPGNARPPAVAVHRRRRPPHPAASARRPGAASPAIFAERQKLLLRWLPNAEPLDLPGLTHFLHAQDPAAVADGLAGFFARQPIPEPL